MKPLQEILKSPTVEGYPRQLFILTDGEVSNTQECIDYVRKNSHTTRVFTFGIGNEASQELVKVCSIELSVSLLIYALLH